MHGGEDLDVAARVEPEPGRDAPGRDVDGEPAGLLGVVLDEEEEVLHPVGDRVLPGVDPVGVGDDAGLLGLAEDAREAHGRDRAAVGQQVPQHLAGADAGQLVDIADEEQVGARRNGLDQLVGQEEVQHGGLVHDDEVGVERPVPVVGGVAPGFSSSRRWTVEASAPVSSARRLAARPVGAASTTFAFLARASSTMERTVKDLPQPGPPVRTATFSVRASLTAASCSGRGRHRSCPQPAERPVPGDVPERRHPVLAGAQEAQQLGGEGQLGAVEGDEVDRGDGVAPSGPGPSPVRLRVAAVLRGLRQLREALDDQAGVDLEQLDRVGDQLLLGR